MSQHAITRDQLQQYFHLPINEVAKELGVCATVLKKICRKNGVPRWPHRKIRSLDKMVAALEETVPRCNEDAARIQQEISTLQSKKQFIISNPTVLALQSNITKPEKKIKHKANRIQEDSDVDISEGINFVINKRLAACWAEDACTHMYGEHSVKCKNNERMHIIESIICFPAPKVVSLEEKENDKRIQYQLPNTRSLFPSWCNNA